MKLKKYYIVIILFCFMVTIFCSKEKSNESVKDKSNKIRYIQSKSGLRLRKEPNLTAVKLALIPWGEQVLIVEEENEEKVIDGVKGKWTKVIYNNITGWVFGGFLSDKR